MRLANGSLAVRNFKLEFDGPGAIVATGIARGYRWKGLQQNQPPPLRNYAGRVYRISASAIIPLDGPAPTHGPITLEPPKVITAAEDVADGFPEAANASPKTVRGGARVRTLLSILKVISPRAARIAQFLERKLEQYQSATRKD